MRFSGSGTGWEGALCPLSPMYPQGALARSLPLDTHHSIYSLCWAATTRKSPWHPLPASSSTRGSGQLPQPVGWKERNDGVALQHKRDQSRCCIALISTWPSRHSPVSACRPRLPKIAALVSRSCLCLQFSELWEWAVAKSPAKWKCQGVAHGKMPIRFLQHMT